MKKNWILLLSISLLFLACKKDSEPESYEDELSPENEQILAGLPTLDGFNLDNIILPNGLTVAQFLAELDSITGPVETRNGRYDDLGPQDARNLMIALIAEKAENLIDDNLHTYSSDGPNKPAQTGLAYSWGMKNHNIRKAPPGNPTANCQEEIFGLDCSGLIAQVFQHAGVTFSANYADYQRRTNNIESAINSAIPAQTGKLKPEDLGTIPPDKFESGDIIYWYEDGTSSADHIGIILKRADGTLSIFQSNGHRLYTCAQNMQTDRGPRLVPSSQAPTFLKKHGYKIVRINAEISGKWDMTLRCMDAGFDFLTLNLDFPATTTNTFTIPRSETYQSDNVVYDLKFDFSYDNVTNVLSCNFLTSAQAYPGFYRNDNFSVKLTRDKLDYFPVTLGNNVNAGCPYEMKLENKE